jgi:hypothetical protein
MDAQLLRVTCWVGVLCVMHSLRLVGWLVAPLSGSNSMHVVGTDTDHWQPVLHLGVVTGVDMCPRGIPLVSTQACEPAWGRGLFGR